MICSPLCLGQGRLDGAFCDFSETDKMDYLQKLQKHGVVNIEMESLAFSALTHHAGIKSAVICVAILDRLKGDQVSEIIWYKSCKFLIFSKYFHENQVPSRFA